MTQTNRPIPSRQPLPVDPPTATLGVRTGHQDSATPDARLVRDLFGAHTRHGRGPNVMARWRGIAADLLAKGWRPPAQVITERADLDKLPPRSVVIDGCEDEILCRREDGYWAEFGSDIVCTSSGVWLPATVVYTPTETGDTE